jgi:DNA-binding MarR family transcriptional regulator
MEITSRQTCDDMFALLKRVKAALLEVAEEYNLTISQVGALYAIKDGETTMGRVAGELHCDASNVTGIIDRLVSQRLVARQESERDRRAKTLQLTPEGQRVVDEIISKLPRTIGCDKLGYSERHSLHVSVQKICA